MEPPRHALRAHSLEEEVYLADRMLKAGSCWELSHSTELMAIFERS